MIYNIRFIKIPPKIPPIFSAGIYFYGVKCIVGPLTAFSKPFKRGIKT